MDRKLFKDLITSVRQAGQIARGELPPSRVHEYSAKEIKRLRKEFSPSQIKNVRRKLKMSQADFANVMLISRATLQSWEQGRRRPEGPALVLIQVMKRNPRAIVEALHVS